MTNTEKDWTGNKNSIFKTLGASNHTDKERENDDSTAEDVTILPPTGENQNYVIPIAIGITAFVVLGVGIVLIRKFVLKWKMS